MKENKGYYGYISKERKKRLLITIVLFAVPALLIITGYLQAHSMKSVLCVIGIVGCLPGCKALVSLIMIFLVRPMDPDDYAKISEHAGDLLMCYEMYLTSYEHSDFLCAAAICGNMVIGYSNRLKYPPEVLEEHITNMLSQNGYKQKVKIFTSLAPFLDRLDSMNKNKESLENVPYKKDDRYPDYDRDHLVAHVLLCLAL